MDDPLAQSLLHRQRSYWASYSSWLSIVFASCLAPFVYNLVLVHVETLIHKLQDWIKAHFNQCEYVLVRGDNNDLYGYVSAFLNFKAEVQAATKNARIRSPMNKVLVFGLEEGVRVVDSYKGAEMEWEYCSPERNSKQRDHEGGRNRRDTYFRLKIQKKDRHLQRNYLVHIANTVTDMESKRRDRQLYTCRGGSDPYWEAHIFKHPATFDSLAVENDIKKQIINDLDEFVESKEYYESVGKPWKRGYLLYGPPGTGKSSLVAAVANYLSYNVYDLDLSGLTSNAELRQLLIQTKDKAVLVVEDIDCCFSTSLNSRKSNESDGITLSGLLNFCDGLWSGSGNERVFIFTTNHVENLDPALLRKGRMDLHICMSYCKPEALKVLVKNYLKITDHDLLPKAETLLEQVQITPADTAEIFLSNKGNPTAAFENLINRLEELLKGEPERDGHDSQAGNICDDSHDKEHEEQEQKQEKEDAAGGKNTIRLKDRFGGRGRCRGNFNDALSLG